MIVTRVLASAFIVVAATSAALIAQKKVDFSGTWMEEVARRKIVARDDEPARGSMPMAPQGPPPQEIITQSAAAIQIDDPWAHGVVRHTFRLDGSESVNRNGANTMTTKTRWEGAKLVTEGTSYSVTSAGESTWKYKEVRWIDEAGAMHTETTHIDEAGRPRVVTRVYTKKR